MLLSILIVEACAGTKPYYKKDLPKREYYLVKKGDTLYSISKKYNIPVEEIEKHNRIRNHEITPGQKIYLPSYNKTDYKPDTEEDIEKINPKKQGVKFIWPVKGTLTSFFGFRFGIPHKGIDIAAPVGTKVLSAESGEVALVESRPKGLGNVIIIRHNKDFITVYGHNYKILVKEGQKVRKGQVIALVGSSGWSTGPHLHFEVRYEGKALNPLKYLPNK